MCYCLSHIYEGFKEFANKRGGNVVDLGVGIIIGGAFSAVVNSFVLDILTPPIGLLFKGSNLVNWFIILQPGEHPDRHYNTPEEAQADGAVTENIGRFINNIIQFLCLAFFLFWLVYIANKIEKEAKEIEGHHKTLGEAVTDILCPWCQLKVPKDAIKCGFCCTFLNEKPPAKADPAPTTSSSNNADTLIDLQ